MGEVEEALEKTVPNTKLLLPALEAYHQSVQKHTAALRDDFVDVSRTWELLSECFESDAADEFRPIWEDTSQRFGEYVEQTSAILRMVGQRIEHLREADRRTGLGELS